MDQMPEIDDFYKRKRRPNKKKGMRSMEDILELEKMRSLPGMYLQSTNSAVSSSSGTNNHLPQTQDSKWRLDTPELKERTSHKNTQLSHDNSRYVDKFIKNKSTVGALQPSYSNDYDMFPPLSSQIRFSKPKNAIKANQHLTHFEAKITSWKKEHEDNAEKTTHHLENKIPIENKSEWKAPNFWSNRREKAFLHQVSDRRETIAFPHERNKTNVHLNSDAYNKGVDEYVKTSSKGVLMEELSLISGQKTNEQESGSDSALTNEQSINLMSSSDKPSSDHFSRLDKSHTKEAANQTSYLSIQKYIVGVQKIGKCVDNLSHSGSSHKKSDKSQQPYSLLESNLDKDDDLSDSYHTQALGDSTEEALVASKNHIISYLKMLLENQEFESPHDNAVEPKRLPSPESPDTDKPESKPDTWSEEVTFETERKLSYKDYSVCEKMLNNYIVVNNLPFGVSREDILYHMNKVGSVSYFIMENNRAHIIFLKAKDAEVAFGLKHVLFGRELVVCRPRRPLCTLHLSGLTNSTPSEDVIKVMSAYGVIIGFYHPIHKFTGAPMGYCFIKVDKQVAENILNESSLTVNNVRIFVEVSSQSEVKFPPQTYLTQQPSSSLSSFHVQGNSEECKVIFTNLPKLASYDLIKEHFQKFGRLQKVYVKNGKGFVIFASRDSLEQALSSKHNILGTEMKLSQGSLVP